MQLAIAALGKVFGVGATAAAGAAGATSAGLGGWATFAKTLQLLAGVGSAVSSFAAANQEADQAELQAGQEQVKGTQRQTAMKRELLKVLGENDVTFANAGIDISGGLAETTATQAKKRASEEITIDRRDADFQAALYRMRAQGLRTRGAIGLGGALLSLASGAISSGIDLSGVG